MRWPRRSRADLGAPRRPKPAAAWKRWRGGAPPAAEAAWRRARVRARQPRRPSPRSGFIEHLPVAARVLDEFPEIHFPAVAARIDEVVLSQVGIVFALGAQPRLVA